MEKYDVTVVVPVYNAENYIQECVDSIKNQTHDFNKIEVILINDGSTDNSLEVCQNIAKESNNIVLITGQNRGVSHARNSGMRIAKGKYVMMLDSDDMLSNNCIEDLLNLFNAHYDEIDLATYSLKYVNEAGKISNSQKYNLYNKGTGIYVLDEYPYMEQSNVNIMFKNTKRRFYDETMELSEDQKFNTETLMEKGNIGFCKEAVYYYRRSSNGLFLTRSNPYYCFEYVLKYNESLIEEFETSDGLPKYIQGIILNTIAWRLVSDQLLPYHLDKKEYSLAIKRMKKVLSKIDDKIILDHPTLSRLHKFYLFKAKNTKIKLEVFNDKYQLKTKDLILVEDQYINCYVNRFKLKDNRLKILACLHTPLFEYTEAELYLEATDNDNKVSISKVDVSPSNLSYNLTDIKTNDLKKFELDLDLSNIKKIKFFCKLNNNKFYLRYEFSKWVGFNSKIKRFNICDKKMKIVYKPGSKDFIIMDNYGIKKLKKMIKETLMYLKINPKIYLFRTLSKTNKQIWLYNDRINIIDNAYYQFKHDFNKDDGIVRYYIYDGDISKIKDKFTEQELKYLIKYKSFEHKKLFLKCSKVLTSFIDFDTYCPFGKGYQWYNDIIKYDLIYLQHGLLHARLIRMYSKEFTEISKIVISSEFERDNLINIYGYNSDDLIESGMPRDSMFKKRSKKATTILFAPSWRKYLIGNMVNNKRPLKKKEFLNSKFYKEIYSFLNSDELIKLLEDNDLKMEFKLHPIFREYKDLFELDDSSLIKISFDEIKVEDYCLFITDFSSFQFDFVRLNIPIIYFVPDMKEFKSGLHSYKQLDLSYEDAFGKLCENNNDIIKELKRVIKNKYQVEEKYLIRMKSFFLKKKNSTDIIYNCVKKMDS